MTVAVSKRVPVEVSSRNRPSSPLLQTGNGLAQVEFGIEWLDLLHQAVHQFLCAAHRKGRDIINGFIGIEFGALAARRVSASQPRALISSRPSSKTWNRPQGPAPIITTSVLIVILYSRNVIGFVQAGFAPARDLLTWDELDEIQDIMAIIKELQGI